MANAKRSGARVLRLMVGLALLGWPRVGSAQGTWSVISLPYWLLGQVHGPRAMAVDAAGNLYVADLGGRIQKRDAEGNWSVIASQGTALGQVDDPSGLAVDGAANLYVAGLRYIGPGNSWTSEIQKRDAQGNWSVIAGLYASALAADSAGNLYAAGYGIQKRDAQGNWSVIATYGTAPGQVSGPTALAVDAAGNLYVADYADGWRIQKRDAQGKWSVIATGGTAVGQVDIRWYVGALAVDGAGNLYVADTGNNRVLKYTPAP